MIEVLGIILAQKWIILNLSKLEYIDLNENSRKLVKSSWYKNV